MHIYCSYNRKRRTPRFGFANAATASSGTVERRNVAMVLKPLLGIVGNTWYVSKNRAQDEGPMLLSQPSRHDVTLCAGLLPQSGHVCTTRGDDNA